MFASDTVVEIVHGLFANSSNDLGTNNILIWETQMK